MKQVLLIATGGTIASKSSDEGLKPLITSDELLGYVPDAKKFCQAHTLQLMNIDSTNMQAPTGRKSLLRSRNIIPATTALWSAMARIPWPTPQPPCLI